MRIAIVSDIHGNRTAFEAVLIDLRQTAPDLVLHGGDLADGGASPSEIVDQIRDLGWSGVVGNADQMLFDPQTLTDAARQSPGLQALLPKIEEMAAVTRELLGDERLGWLRGLPLAHLRDELALVHAGADTAWRAPSPEASDTELQSAYKSLNRPLAIYAHIHRPYIRAVGDFIVANTGSVSLPYDGDRRASYLLLDNLQPSIRRVEYNIEKEKLALIDSGFPYAGWLAKTLSTGRFQLP